MTDTSNPDGAPRRNQEAYPASSGPRPPSKAIDSAKPQPSKRAEEVFAQRRRRQDTGPLAGLKLYVPENLKETGFTYRWIKDDDRRIHDKTVDDDWDIVRNKVIDGTGEGTPVSRIVGKDKSGQPVRAFLCKKPEEFYKLDKAKEWRYRVDAREEDIKRGAAGPGGLAGPTSYIPNVHGDGFSTGEGVNRIERG